MFKPDVFWGVCVSIFVFGSWLGWVFFFGIRVTDNGASILGLTGKGSRHNTKHRCHWQSCCSCRRFHLHFFWLVRTIWTSLLRHFLRICLPPKFEGEVWFCGRRKFFFFVTRRLLHTGFDGFKFGRSFSLPYDTKPVRGDRDWSPVERTHFGAITYVRIYWLISFLMQFGRSARPTLLLDTAAEFLANYFFGTTFLEFWLTVRLFDDLRGWLGGWDFFSFLFR